MAKRQTRPPCLPNFKWLLNTCHAIGRGKGAIIAAGGQIVHTDRKRTHTRWNNISAAYAYRQQLRRTRSYTREIMEATSRLRTAEMRLADSKCLLHTLNERLAKDGRSVIRLDHLRVWIKTHMPSILAVAVKDDYLRVRFCATVMRGAGERSESPNRYIIPAMWITINLDTGAVTSAFSDGLSGGAIHPHANMDNGSVCGGNAIVASNRQPVLLDDLKKILAEVELWRMRYGDDVFETAKNLAGVTWDAVTYGRISLVPIQGMTGLVYGNVTELLRAEPWDGGPSDNWCGRCDAAFNACGCCRDCGDRDCRCGSCHICGSDQNSCDCCRWCEDKDPLWVYRGSTNEHRVCNECGYCRTCENRRGGCDSAAGNWSNTLSFLTETDAVRVTELATLEHDRRVVRPVDYSEDCVCRSCRPHTEYLNSTQ